MSEDHSVYAAFIPNSPDRHIFRDFSEVNNFLKSPENKKLNKSARFKKCANDSEVDSFYNENSALDLSFNDLASSTSTLMNGTPLEPKALFSEPDPPLLNRFRVTVDRKDDRAFDDALSENPRFILNTSVDGPTILQGAQRHNVMHVACGAGNLHVVNTVFDLLESPQFLQRAYGQIADPEALVDHLLDSFINTPDKNANNTPLHFACKNGHLEVVKRLISYDVCKRSPINRFEKTPADLNCQTFKGSAQEKSNISSQIKNLLFSVSTPKKHQIERRFDGMMPAILHDLHINQLTLNLVDLSEDDEFFDALDFEDEIGAGQGKSCGQLDNAEGQGSGQVVDFEGQGKSCGQGSGQLDNVKGQGKSCGQGSGQMVDFEGQGSGQENQVDKDGQEDSDLETEEDEFFDAFEPLNDSMDKLSDQLETLELKC